MVTQPLSQLQTVSGYAVGLSKDTWRAEAGIASCRGHKHRLSMCADHKPEDVGVQHAVT